MRTTTTMSPLLRTIALLLTFVSIISAQSVSTASTDGGGYTGYNLSLSQDEESATYDTSSTPANVSVSWPEPDVYLNASVFVGEISILVANLTAKINLDAQVLSLLKFNAGVDLHIDKVSLLIQNISAKVVLEARLENLVLMIDDILESLDLNPILATLGQSLNNITDSVGDVVGGVVGTPSSSVPGSAPTAAAAAAKKRRTGIDPLQFPYNYEIQHNILYTINDYTGHSHTNRVLSQTGAIVDQSLDDMGHVVSEKEVGTYEKDMRFNGDNITVVHDGKEVWQLEYVYEPFRGLIVLSYVFVDQGGRVVGTQVASEGYAGGSSTIGDN
ncbi:hypothetical protein ONS95_004625 [Cadophora gregata]|uniref:uncharacterized protein n=1 Tax=Cadophora gregata TaxID=51156 RepID=UPI0026DD2970|nr:uncharacterized protein ONS95_004625 [Cadophora gregata]KAK0105005.1 hypothetical protein ONS96_004413 [Cadophora gregata f. sp. sojae]KAK0106123.1 hypothetical protein ONS95_004625 [Cadophora gregata]